MKICFLMYHGSMYSGGQGVYLYYLTRELTRLGHEVHVIAAPPYPTLPEGVTIHKLKSFSWYRYLDNAGEFIGACHERPWELLYPLNLFELASTRVGVFTLMFTFSLRALVKFKELQAKYNFDVVHDNQSLGLGLLGIKAMGVPVVATIHHPLSIDVRNAAIQARGLVAKARRLIWYPIPMQSWVAPRLDKIITVSRASAAAVAEAFGVPPALMHIVYNGIDTETFRPLPVDKQPNTLIYVGNSEDRNKGIVYLFQALRILRDKMDFRVIFVDQPWQHLKLASRLTRRYSLSTRIDFTGRVAASELAQLYNQAQIMVCPSIYEGFGMPAAEAMACGVPAVATTGGALPEVVEDGVTGILVPTRDPQALADAIRRLLTDTALAGHMGQLGQERVRERFGWRRAALETLEVYREAGVKEVTPLPQREPPRLASQRA